MATEKKQIVHIPKRLWISFCLKELLGWEYALCEGHCSMVMMMFLLNSASGIESGHQVQSQCVSISFLLIVKAVGRSRHGIKENKWKWDQERKVSCTQNLSK